MTQTLAGWIQNLLAGSRGIWKILAIMLFCLLVGALGGAILALLTPTYTAALVVVLVAGLLMLRDTQWGLAMLVSVICLLPFAAVPLDVGFEPTFLDLILMGLVFVWASRIATRRHGPFIASPLAVPILVFLVIVLAAFVGGLAHSSITMTLLRRFAELILGILTFFIVVNCVRTRTQLEQVARVLILAGAGAALIGVVLYVLPTNTSVRLLSFLRYVRYPAGSGVLRYIEDDPELPLRAISTSQDPNVLGGLLIIVTGFTVPQLISRRPLLPLKATAPMIGIMVLCLILTFSRGSMGGLVVGVGMIALLRYRRLGWLLLAGAALLLLLPQGQVWLQHAIEGVRGEDLATQMRFGEYKDAFTVIMRHPWIGVGFSNTPEIDLYVGVSNVYLLIAEEAGLLGLTAFLLIIVLFFAYLWRGTRLARGDSGLEAILWGVWAALAGVLAGGMLDHYLFNLAFPHAATLFWTCVGLAVATIALAERQHVTGELSASIRPSGINL